MSSKESKADLDRLVKVAIEEVSRRSITLGQLLEAIAPAVAEDAGAPEVVALPQEITPAQADAIEKITEVFGSVVPIERRALSPAEVAQLVEEKETLDELKRLAVSRGENIRTTVFNHLDVEAEERGDWVKKIPRDKEGHYVLGGEALAEPDTGKKFTREVRNGAASLNLAALEALVDDPDTEFSRKDFLSITSQIRVVDENKLLVALKKNPRLILAISKATQAGRRVASMNLRKA